MLSGGKEVRFNDGDKTKSGGGAMRKWEALDRRYREHTLNDNQGNERTFGHKSKLWSDFIRGQLPTSAKDCAPSRKDEDIMENV